MAKPGVMSLTASKGNAGLNQRRFVLIGNAGSVRVEGFQQALAAFRQPSVLVSYADLLSGRVHLAHRVEQGDVVRLESPGRDWLVEQALLLAGADIADDEDGESIFNRLSRREIETSNFEQGRLWASRQWFLGWRETLRFIAAQLGECAPHRVMNAPHEIAEMFDKPRCHRTLRDHDVPVPRTLGVIRSYDDLTEKMRAGECRRVFVKLAHGSSAAGIVAFRTDGGQRFESYTSTEVVRKDGQVRLYNSRRIRKILCEKEIAEVIDALCGHRAHVEEWLPKASFEGRTFDLRVVVMAGRTRHIVVRLSRSPMTNLHLLNERADADALRAIVPEAAWKAALETCRRATELYPQSFLCGADLMFMRGFGRHAILELNAFGDLLPGTRCDGEDTYQAQVRLISRNET